ncbi:MAG: DUF1003 domain-containing protein [Pyrinomonadaceae bacterium]
MHTEITLSDEVRSLSLIPMFKQLDAVELEKLAELTEQISLKAGQMVFHQNDPGDALYIVESGTVRLWVLDEDAKQVTLSELQAGDFTGEIAVLDNGERSANATTLTDTVLHKLRSDHFQDFLLQHPPIAVDVIREIGRRMRQTNLLISQRISRNVNVEMENKATIGQRIADRVASFGGSWTFIIIYGTALVSWMALNSFVLSHYGKGEAGAQFDPYPYILLNLMLSMTAAMQAPIIMMSQNRSAEKDRLAAEQDFHVNLKSELLLEELIRRDDERAEQMNELISSRKQLAAPSSNDGAQIS